MSYHLGSTVVGYIEGIEFCLEVMVASLDEPISAELGSSWYAGELDRCLALHTDLIQKKDNLTAEGIHYVLECAIRKHADLVQRVDERFGQGHPGEDWPQFPEEV